MKVSDVIGFRPTLEKIANKEMDGKTALKFAKVVRAALEEIQEFETKRADLFIKYGEEITDNEGKKGVRIKKENETKYNTAIKKVLSARSKLVKVDIASLGIEIAPADLINSLALFK